MSLQTAISESQCADQAVVAVSDDSHRSRAHFCVDRQIDLAAAVIMMEEQFSAPNIPKLTIFQRHLGALLATFQTMQQEDRTKAVAMTREAVGRMQAVVKYQLCNDALRTVAALAENMIQEAYGFTANAGDLQLAPSPSIGSSEVRDFQQSTSTGPSHGNADISLSDFTSTTDLSIDNTDVLTNALYATLQAVNPCELSPPMPNSSSSSSSDHLSSSSSVIPSTISFQLPPPPASTPNGRSVSQLTLNSFFVSSPSKSSDDQSRPGNRLLKCTQCDYVAVHRQNLHRHEKLHDLRQLPSEQYRRYSCSICDRRFVTKWAVKEHVKYKHPTDNETVRTESAPSDESSNAVEIVMSKNFNCEYCGKEFPLRNVMTRHIKMVHFKNRDFQCTNCDKAFSNNYHLQRHIQTVHMALRVHDCPICGKSFSTAYHVTRHVKNLHK